VYTSFSHRIMKGASPHCSRGAASAHVPASATHCSALARACNCGFTCLPSRGMCGHCSAFAQGSSPSESRQSPSPLPQWHIFCGGHRGHAPHHFCGSRAGPRHCWCRPSGGSNRGLDHQPECCVHLSCWQHHRGRDHVPRAWGECAWPGRPGRWGVLVVVGPGPG
jgi:hypothetical protein